MSKFNIPEEEILACRSANTNSMEDVIKLSCDYVMPKKAEKKSKCVNYKIRESVYKDFKDACEKNNVSMNDVIDRFMEQFAKNI